MFIFLYYLSWFRFGSFLILSVYYVTLTAEYLLGLYTGNLVIWEEEGSFLSYLLELIPSLNVVEVGEAPWAPCNVFYWFLLAAIIGQLVFSYIFHFCTLHLLFAFLESFALKGVSVILNIVSCFILILDFIYFYILFSLFHNFITTYLWVLTLNVFHSYFSVTVFTISCHGILFLFIYLVSAVHGGLIKLLSSFKAFLASKCPSITLDVVAIPGLPAVGSQQVLIGSSVVVLSLSASSANKIQSSYQPVSGYIFIPRLLDLPLPVVVKNKAFPFKDLGTYLGYSLVAHSEKAFGPRHVNVWVPVATKAGRSFYLCTLVTMSSGHSIFAQITYLHHIKDGSFSIHFKPLDSVFPQC